MATAWSFVAGYFVSPHGVCIEPPDAGMLEDAERRVPGTAGFVARFLDVLQQVSDLPDAAAALHDAARAMLPRALRGVTRRPDGRTVHFK